MNYAPAANARHPAFLPNGGTSIFGSWLRSGLRLLVPAMFSRTAPRDRASEAAQVRAYAERMHNSDPGFASDLFAAADRHERMQN